MKQGLSLRVSQHLALTPQLQQSIRLLQLSTLELSQEVEQMLDENPFLEQSMDEAPGEDFGLAQADTPVRDEDRDTEAVMSSGLDYATEAPAESRSESESPLTGQADEHDWGGDGTHDVAPDDGEWGGDALPRNGATQGEDGEADATELARSQESLASFLHRQALALRLSEEDTAALRFLIESLNDDGYLEDSLEELAAGFAGDDPEAHEELVHRFTVALRLLQNLEPPGVGARNLGECLALQIRALPEDEIPPPLRRTALRMCRQSMDLLARRDLRRLANLCGDNEAGIKAALALITRLEPKPGRKFVDVERNVIVPDVIVVKSGRGANVRFRAQLNADVMPRLRVHDIYANALKQHRGGGREASDTAALQQRLQEARWFIKNIQQRFDTILRVSNAIVERQKNFFTHGALAMRPLVLREIADELGLHESTISRVTTAKYMATPFGTFELKYFFGSSLGTETGGNASSTAVRALIKQFVTAEDPKKPLSDSQLSEMLKEQGIECARRTVAKYREALRIAPTNLRKAL
ncbi:RNA polymerase factor sigma-54 [Pseudorhodoferax sp. Leaf265]|jgi:RNA polymerase sigma-54 factor|uniref:RNA polymerase factor sigma-54 n=1 Tax=Pseudorhodoferax sp. Leaf265 TaxID=1736315 RepID=UPI0006FB2996|nr:RNA polymerase factor sigma-54 [Pseudorhodoferax sp. Leaf265]KQP20760.1 RNA polymerase sigma-54 factor [Pseudorhodoferax sp. Leaf265]PZP99256.1 MAG: RNA polymerase factor sigma-54 [Variovorax paradoxus]PZQ11057.1 MAG: RNA polymerase factor sigma-54 [Variovorax paradoxus]